MSQLCDPLSPATGGAPETTANVAVVSFGCRLNAYEAEIIRKLGREAGLRDTIVVNTCAVTAEAERQARQAIRKLRRERPDARIIVTGCAAQVDPERFAAMPEVTRVLGNAEKLDPAAYCRDAGERIVVGDIMAVRETAPHLASGFETRARAFVEVQQGCDHRCTFCIIPYGRGPSRSVPPERIVIAVQGLVDRGFQEVVLTGVDITSYGGDLGGVRLGTMVGRLLAEVPDLPRLRLSSLDPAAIDDDLLRLVAEEPRLMPHLHLSLQAGDDLILKRMARRHRRDQAVALSAQLKALRPDLALGADLIAGFPTESEEMFERTLALVEECGLTYLHVFPYSPRAGTPAARMPQVATAVRRDRARRLRARGDEALARALAMEIGRTHEVLVEERHLGRSPQFAAVTLDRECRPGALERARITAVEGDTLIGQALG